MTAVNFINGLQLRHFSSDEILYLGASHSSNSLNGEPPEDLWSNIVRTAWVADMAREKLGRPLRVLSGYRNPAYNRSVGGATQSEHLQFRALDLATDDPRKLFELLRGFREAGVFKGGIGLYSSFVHVDTRGTNATWGA